MADATIRLGKISSINYEAGKARVVYEDRDKSVTSELPFLAWQYHMPKINDLVVVACFSNGTVAGVILGPIYGAANVPHKGAEGVFRQEMSNVKNEAVLFYDEKKRKLLIRAPLLELEGYEYDDQPIVSIEQINDAFADIDDNKQKITTLFDDTQKTEGKDSLQKQIDALDQRLSKIGG
jgi:phage baseplate assembly protein gpV